MRFAADRYVRLKRLPTFNSPMKVLRRIPSAWVLLLLLLAQCSSEQQGAVTIGLTEHARDAGGGVSLEVLYPFTELEDEYRHSAKFPNMSTCSDSAYARTYFTGSSAEAAVENGILILVCDYSSEKPTFYVDRNNNLDFTDDNEPLSFSDTSSYVDLSVANAQHPEARYTVRWSRFSTEEKQRFGNSANYQAKGKTFVDFYREERLNILAGDYNNGIDSFRIALMDWNVNGVYNDVGEDRILFGDYGAETLKLRLVEGAVELDTVNFFQAQQSAFAIAEVSATGATLKIRPTLSATPSNRLEVGERLFQ